MDIKEMEEKFLSYIAYVENSKRHFDEGRNDGAEYWYGEAEKIADEMRDYLMGNSEKDRILKEAIFG